MVLLFLETPALLTFCLESLVVSLGEMESVELFVLIAKNESTNAFANSGSLI